MMTWAIIFVTLMSERERDQRRTKKQLKPNLEAISFKNIILQFLLCYKKHYDCFNQKTRYTKANQSELIQSCYLTLKRQMR